MEIDSVEKLRLTVLQPLGTSQGLTLGTVAITATIITDALVVTVIALLDVTTECCGSTPLDRTHDATLCGGQRSAMVVAKGFTVAAEDIRHFEPETPHRIRSVVAGWALARQEPDAAAGPAGWTWHRSYWWRFVDIWPWWPDCDDQATAEWCGHLCRTRANARQTRGGHAELGMIESVFCPAARPGRCDEGKRFLRAGGQKTH